MTKTKAQNSSASLAQLSFSRMWWLLATAIAAAIFLGFGSLTVIQLFSLPIALFILGLTLAAALDPVVSWLEHRTRRLPAIILVYLVLLILLGGLIWAVAPSVAGQLQGFGAGVPGIVERTREAINFWSSDLFGDNFTETLASELGSLNPALLRLPVTITAGIFQFVIVLFVSIYTLISASSMESFWLSLFPEDQRARIAEIIKAMARAMGGYIRGVVINGAIVGFFTFIGLFLLGVNFALALGVLAGLLELIPVIGPLTAGALIVGMALLQSPIKSLEALIFIILMQQLENHILVPNIMRSQTNISPLLSILALLAGGLVGGLLGAIIAIPVAAAGRVLVREVLAPPIRRETGAEPVEGELQGDAS